METTTITLKQARPAVKLAFKAKRPIMLWGQPGIGKSELVEQLAAEMEGVAITVMLSQLDPTDLRGLPIPVTQPDGSVVTRFAPPSELPGAEFCKKYKTVILFLDEANSALPATASAAYQLVLNRRLGEYVLPENVLVILAGNRNGDRGVTYKMPAPLANRLVHLELRVDFESWMEWAMANNIHRSVVSYLNFAKNKLNTFDPKHDVRSFATPRSWTFVSQIIHESEAEGVSDDTLFSLIAGSVGEGVALEFNAYRRLAADLPQPEDILNGTITKLEKLEISSQYSLVFAMVFSLLEYSKKPKDEFNSKEYHRRAANYLTFCMENFQAEMVITAADQLLNARNRANGCRIVIPREFPDDTFSKFQVKYGKYIVQSMS
jgi:hypothetical protein